MVGIMKTSAGPFGILDLVGLDTAYEIKRYWAQALHDPEIEQITVFLKTSVELGRLGSKSGGGFYSYPSPAFEQPGFIQGKHHLPGLEGLGPEVRRELPDPRQP